MCLYAGIVKHHGSGILQDDDQRCLPRHNKVSMSLVGFLAFTATMRTAVPCFGAPSRTSSTCTLRDSSAKFVRRRCGHKSGLPDFTAQPVALASTIPQH